ncbi:hypothetical protein P8452_42410 [Trifolium repens]|nr:hypothetical protein P8452_42410 [Trifolium repens]
MILNSTSVAEVFGRIDHKSNIYASKGMWDGENRIQSKGLRKAPGGGSWIEIWQRIGRKRSICLRQIIFTISETVWSFQLHYRPIENVALR